LDFNIKNLWAVEVFGGQFWITQTILNTWILMALMISFAVFIRIKLVKFTEVPASGLQNIIELMIESFDNFVRGSAGDKRVYLGGWFFMVFSFVLISNLSGALGFRPPTADWATTFSFAIVTFMLIQVMGVKYRGMEYIKSFLVPHWVFLPLNLIGELARPISLSFRLFGNILGGMILITLVYNMAPMYVRFVIPSFLHFYFDIFIGALQTYVFCVLSMTFIGVAATPDEA